MTPDFILWGIPGFISLLVFQIVRPARNRSGWDFVAQTAFFGMVCFVSARILLVSINSSVPVETSASVRDKWHYFFPFQGSLHFFVGILLSFPCGLIFAFIWERGHGLISLACKLVSGKSRNLQFSDIFFESCHNLLSEMVLIILDTEKAYVGILLAATSDPNENSRFLKITPIMSGHRRRNKAGNLKMVFDTDYVADVTDYQDLPDRDFLIPVPRIVTMARFDPELHEKFIKVGKTIMGEPEGLDSTP